MLYVLCGKTEKTKDAKPRSNYIVVLTKIRNNDLTKTTCSFLFLFTFDLNDLSSVFVVRSYERESEIITGFPVQHTRQCLYSLMRGRQAFSRESLRTKSATRLSTVTHQALTRSPTRPSFSEFMYEALHH